MGFFFQEITGPGRSNGDLWVTDNAAYANSHRGPLRCFYKMWNCVTGTRNYSGRSHPRGNQPMNSVSQVDRVFRVAFPITFLIFNMVYWIVYWVWVVTNALFHLIIFILLLLIDLFIVQFIHSLLFSPPPLLVRWCTLNFTKITNENVQRNRGNMACGYNLKYIFFYLKYSMSKSILSISWGDISAHYIFNKSTRFIIEK